MGTTMVEKEKLAHDLTIVYLNNRFGIDVSGRVSDYDDDELCDVEAIHFPGPDEIKYKRIGTGEKGFLGFEKKVKVESGLEVDEIFVEMISEYYKAYNRFLMILNDIEVDEDGNVDPRSVGVAWFCDNCKERLDLQPDFDWRLESWKCNNCGYENDLSAGDII